MASISHKVEFLILKSFQFMFGMIGLKNSRKVASKVGVFFNSVIPIRKKVILKNLHIAFPEKSEEEINALTKNIYIGTATSFIEILCMPYMSKEQLIEQVELPNLEYLKNIVAEGKGMILMTGHFGNWEFAATSVGLQLQPVVGITKLQSNPYVNADMDAERRKYGNKTVHLGLSIREVYKALKQKEVVALVGDQRGPSDGPRVNFFNRSSAAYTGPAALSLKSGAPLLFGVMFRQKDGHYIFEMKEVSKENLPENEAEAVLEFTQRHALLLEEAIRQQPESWFWMHNRWKY